MKARNYRSIRGQLYTREEYISGAPQPRITRFTHGKHRDDYEIEMKLIANETVLVRDNALEAIRITANKNLAKRIGDEYYLRILIYPHHVLRENKMMTGAGADRLQEGMRRAFGKPIGRAAAVRRGQTILLVRTYKRHENKVREALRIAASKFPKGARMNVVSIVK
ncbi:50S ribosomal protein L16 [Candidatus Geothermarchaeota archaeon]|nr:MAG: 50S ribosomal protein L16 [Candidatus Geothermarchaeota archaeon]